MTRVGLLFLLVARVAYAQSVPVISPTGGYLPERLEIEWLGPEGTSLAVESRQVQNGRMTLQAPPQGVASVRVVGPDVVSFPIAWKDRAVGFRLAAAGKLRLQGIPRGVTTVRVFMELERSTLDYSREVNANGANEIELAVPVGTYSAAIDLGRERAPIVIRSLAIRNAHSATVGIEDVKGTQLTLQISKREGNQPLAGASISGIPTTELPPVLWRALTRRCGVSDTSGRLACGIVPLPLRSIDVTAPLRRRRHVSFNTKSSTNDPKQSFKISLAPYQDVQITAVLDRNYPAKFVRGLTAVLWRCNQTVCDESNTVRKELGPHREAAFLRLEPGTYRLRLENALVHSSTKAVVVSDDSDAEETVNVTLHLNLWHILGSTHLTDAVGVPAKIWLGTFHELEHQQELAAVVESDSSGGYDTFLLAEPGVYLWAHAISARPPAEGETLPPGVKLLEGNDRILLDIEMSTSGGVVKLVDKETKEPVPNCKVALYHWGPASGGMRLLTSDANGVVHWLGISQGTFVGRALCEGYRPASTEKVQVSASSDETILELEPAGAVQLRVRDAYGNPLPGALIYLEQSTSENVKYPFQIAAEQLGATDFLGEIAVPTRPRPGFYVLAPGHALYVARLTPCTMKSGCVEDIQLAMPVPFSGLRVRSSEGEPESAAWLVFSKDGVPIPVSIQSELLRINGADVRSLIIREGLDTIHMLPGLFGPGIYDVAYARARPGGVPELIPLIRMKLPTAQRIDLTLPPSPRSK